MEMGLEIGTFLFPCLLLFSLLLSQSCSAVDNITSSKPLLTAQTLSSPDQVFELGFFSPNDSGNLYVGIWYKKLSPRTVVWVANREKPVTDSMAILTVSSNGNLVLMEGNQTVVWSSNITVSSNGSTAELLDTGNFVLKDSKSGETFWESFNHPCDVQLPGQTLMSNPKTGEKRVLTSWKTYSDPSPGDYVAGISLQVPPQLFAWNRSVPYWRSGPWSKTKFIGIQEDPTYLSIYSPNQFINNETVNYTYYTYSSSIFAYSILLPNGTHKFMHNEGKTKGWSVDWISQKSPCDVYGKCGPFGVCKRSEHPKCKCLKGFRPKSHKEWGKGNYTDGCVRRAKLLCENSTSTVFMQRKKPDSFLHMVRMKIPDLYEYVRVGDQNVCQQECLKNCSCLAYTFVSGIGCLIWTRELVDTVEFSSSGEDLFVRVAHAESGNVKLIIGLTTASAFIILNAVTCGLCRLRAKQRDTIVNSALRHDLKQKDSSDLLLFNFHTLLVATNNFSDTNKIGYGGFGSVYKAKLQDGKDVAVKRLSSSSGQGIDEFKNEITLISKLQHRNLVRLLGYCIEKEEKILIYEFMINKSLDTFLFDPRRKLELAWAKRFNIIQGVARGLLYLHRDSCLRVIHRDLKVSNILLDGEMNPKISDFGLARIFQGTEDLVSTLRVVGTLGYMSPEYALRGKFSEKSDVFSFGVLVLEIVCGRKTASFNDDVQYPSLHAYAWESWCQNNGLRMLDQALSDSYSPSEVMRCVHIALLCVQDHPMDRPNMSQVVSMLNSETELPPPIEPTFAFQQALKHDGLSRSNFACSFTESMMQGR